MKNDRAIIFFLFFLIAGLFLYIPLASSNIDFIWMLTKEDSFYENSSALFFLLTSLIFFYLYLHSQTGNNFSILKTKKNIFFLLLAIVFFVGFGEEISWGQRLLGVNTPDYIKSVNMQGEINLHNLKWFHRFSDTDQTHEKSFWKLMLDFGRLYMMFWLSFCIIVPFLNKICRPLKNFFSQINIPIVPLWIGIFFLFNYALSNIIYQFVIVDKFTSLMEIKETISSYIFLLVSIYFLSTKNIEKNSLKRN